MKRKLTTDVATIIEQRNEWKARAEKAEAEAKRYREALEKLARLGNGDELGNSDGNMIARVALDAGKE